LRGGPPVPGGGGRWRRHSGASLATLFEAGIGVSNVNERLKVLFGDDYRLWVDSQPGRGTRIEIEVPELQTHWAAVS
jgi:sensor histidine kinase YesM